MTTHSNGKPIIIEFGEEYVITDPGNSMWKVGTVLTFLSNNDGIWRAPSGASGVFTMKYDAPLALMNFSFTMTRNIRPTMEEMYKELM